MLTQDHDTDERREQLDPLSIAVELDEMTSAIAAVFFDDARHLDVRYLWSRGTQRFFRVNWWRDAAGGSPRVLRSAFVRVEPHGPGYRVSDVTRREAA